MHSPPEETSEWSEPWWIDHRRLLCQLGDSDVPTPERLNGWLPRGAKSGGGKPLRFVAASSIPGVEYERHIFEAGEVSTRAGSWHDVFNALAWCALPRLKAALNALHFAHLEEARDGRRGKLRDALTLLDESGAIVVSRDRALLEALAARDWRGAYLDRLGAWQQDVRVVICGHGLMEKLQAPYKSITAHVLLLYQDVPASALRNGSFLANLDAAVAERLLGGLCRSPADLSPLPLMGIPGWWPGGDQDRSFYQDPTVFRAALPGTRLAPVHGL